MSVAPVNPMDEVETRTMGIATVDEMVRWLEDRVREAASRRGR